jgi:hypothetical protein
MCCVISIRSDLVTKVIEQQGHILQINIITLIVGSKYIFEVTNSLLREVPPL